MPQLDMIDVSDNDGIIFLHPVVSAGVKIIGIKATEGATRTDPDFSTYVARADMLALPRIIYHLLRDTPAPAQFDNYMAAVKGRGAFLPCIDYEDLSKTTDARFSQFQALMKEHLTTHPVYYSPIAYLIRLGLVTPEENLWPPEYPSPGNPMEAPRIGHWHLWQYNEFGDLPGAGATHLDFSMWNPAKGDMKAWYEANKVSVP